MSRLLVAAVAIVAGIVVPAIAAVSLPRTAAAAPGLPTLPTPTVTVPTLPTPTLPTPTLPTPTVPTPTVPAPTVPTPTVRTPTIPTPTVTAPSVGPPTSSGRSPVATTPATPPSYGGTAIGGSAQNGRPGSGGPNGSRGAVRPRISRFRLAKSGLVGVSAWELAPRCRFVGRYVFPAGRGVGVLRLPRRIGKHRLGAGTYRFVGSSRGATVLDLRFRLVRRQHGLRVRRHHLTDVCAVATVFTATERAAGWPLLSGGGGSPAPVAASRPSAAARSHGGQPGFLPPVLHALNPANASPLVRAIFFALLGCAIMLLGTASLPERATVAAAGGFVTQHRPALTIAGFVLLAAAALLLGLV